MTQVTDFELKISCALHIANNVIREDGRGNAEAAARAHQRLVAMVEDAEDDMFLLTLAKRLGRKRSKAVMIENEVVDLAVDMARRGQLV